MGRALLFTLQGALAVAAVGVAIALVGSSLGGWDAYVWSVMGALLAALAALVVVGALLLRRLRGADLPRGSLALGVAAALGFAAYLGAALVAGREDLTLVHFLAAGLVIALCGAAVGASLPALRKPA